MKKQQQQSLFVLLPNTCNISQNNIKNKVSVLAAWNNLGSSGARPWIRNDHCET